jgi:cell wall-associated NlpC family hydrolase
MGKLVSAAVIGVVTLSVGLVLVVVVVAGSGSGSANSANSGTAGNPDSPSPGGAGAGAAPGSGGVQPGAAIPAGWLTLYQQAASSCAGLSWSVLAAVGTLESGSGQSTAPGVWSGANGAGAEGPMQFEPATFAAYATVGPGGAQPASPYDPTDAVYTASALLCGNGGGAPSTLRAAIANYNHSDSYVNTVLTLALAFEEDPTTSGTVVAALSFAARQLNTPYVWGGAGAGGFDCSGLAQVAYRSAGIALPRVAQDQFDVGPPVPGGSMVQPGDLIFFGNGPTAVDHVGLYVGAGEMIDAPHTGALVRFDSAHWPGLVGATRPG